jgi:hypothetical protein
METKDYQHQGRLGDLVERSTYSVIDHRSTSSSPESEKSRVRPDHAGFHANVVKYIDFESPILKHLIDIEQKYWSSETNQAYRLPKRDLSADSEMSLHSLAGITSYDLATQNQKRPLSARIHTIATVWERPNMNKLHTEARSCDGKTIRMQPKDSSEEIDTQKYCVNSRTENSQGKKSLGKLHSKVETKLRIKQLCQEALKKDIVLGMKTPMIKGKQEKTHKLFLKKSTINSKANSPPRVQTSGREGCRKSGLKESSRRGFNRKDFGLATKLDISDKFKYSYLKLESSDMNPKKIFLKKFNSLLKKGSGHSYLKDLKEKSNRKLEEDRRKSQADLLSNSKMFSKLIQLPASSSKPDKQKVSSRELLTKLNKDMLGKHSNIRNRYKMDLETRGSTNKSQHFSLNLMNSHILKTPKDIKTTTVGSLKAKHQVGALTQTRTSSNKQSRSKKRTLKENSQGKTSKKRHKSPDLRVTKQHLQTLGATEGSKTLQKSGENKKDEDRLRKTNIDSNLITTALKHKIWSKLTSKGKQKAPGC